MENIEVWKSLECIGFPNYEISNFGNVKSLNYNHTKKEKILKPVKDKYGYLRVALFQNKKEKRYRVHQLVALAFIPNPNNLPCINHKDENKENNHINNLEWCTHEYNNNYGTRNERAGKKMKGEKHPMFGKHHTEETIRKLSKAKKGKPNYKHRKPILQFTLDGDFIREWESGKSASEELKINQTNISKCCKGKLKTAYGFIWKYKE